MILCKTFFKYWRQTSKLRNFHLCYQVWWIALQPSLRSLLILSIRILSSWQSDEQLKQLIGTWNLEFLNSEVFDWGFRMFNFYGRQHFTHPENRFTKNVSPHIILTFHPHIIYGKMGHIPIQSWYSSGHIFYDRVTFWNRFWDFWNPQRVESIINTFFQWITDWNRS